MMTDPIADMLTRLRNAQMIGKSEVSLPYSKIKQSIAEILKSSGYLAEVKVVQAGAFSQLVLQLSSAKNIRKIRRISKPGRRIYAKASKMPVVLGGRGVMIVSTSRGIMTDNEARKQRLGGELMCEVQ